MGLDMYAYVANRAGQQNEYYEQDLKFNPNIGDYDPIEGGVEKPREIAYWRKHPNLHGWMEQLAKSKKLDYSTFNGVELELDQDDLDALEECVLEGSLPSTTGFFFGNEADDIYKETDLEFIKRARAELFCGLKVFYNSSW